MQCFQHTAFESMFLYIFACISGLVNVEKTDAESLTNAIELFCTGKGIEITKCRYVGFDGANVMSGELSGTMIMHIEKLRVMMFLLTLN